MAVEDLKSQGVDNCREMVQDGTAGGELYNNESKLQTLRKQACQCKREEGK